MIGTDRCVYETPCRWCTKWDKKCDRKIGTTSPYNGLFDRETNACNHEWLPTNAGGANNNGTYNTYYCKKCGQTKDVYD